MPGLTVKTQVALEDIPLLSVRVTVKFDVPEVPFKLPVINPVVALIERPEGRLDAENL